MKTSRTKLLVGILMVISIALLGLFLAGCADSNGVSAQQKNALSAPTPVLKWILTGASVVALAFLFALPVIRFSHGEIITGIVIVFLLLLYYAHPIVNWFFGIHYTAGAGPLGEVIANIAEFLQRPFGVLITVQDFVLAHLPQQTWSIGKITILRLETKSDFAPTLVPLCFLVVGVAIRVAVDRYVRNERLRTLTGEYWIYVLAYLLLAYIISAITNWSFLAVVAMFLLIFVALALGLLRVAGDILSALVHVLRLLWRTLRIAAKGIVSLVTVVADYLKLIGRKIRDTYVRYVVDPIIRAYERVLGFLQKLEDRLDDFLKRNPH